MKTRRGWANLVLFAALVPMAGACTDPSYDFDRTDRTVTLMGETLSIPLGQTRALTVGDLLGDQMEDYLVALSDGTLSVQYTGKPLSFTFDELKKIDGSAPFARFCDFPISHDFSLFTKPGKPAYDAQGEADLSGSVPGKIQLKSVSRDFSASIPNMPKELSSLKSITLTEQSRVELTLTIPDCPFISGTVTPDLRFDLGSLFVNKDFPDGILKFDTPLDSKNGYTATKSFPLHSFSLAPGAFDPSTHTLNVDANVEFRGNCTISKPRTNRALFEKAPREIQLQVTAVMHDIACKEIEGAFDYSRKSQVSFPLGDFAGSIKGKLGGGEVFFDFLDPTILLDIESNITIPITAKLTLAARQNRVKYAEVKNLPVAFPCAEPGKSASTHIQMGKNPGKNPGEYPVTADFSRLLTRIPDDLLITADAATQSDKTAVLRIGETYKVTLSPKLILPLSLGADTNVEVRDTVAIPATLGRVLKDNTLQLVGHIRNGFPLQLAFSLVLTDPEGNALTDPVHLTLAEDRSQEVAFTLALKPGTDPETLDSAILSFTVGGIPEGRPVKADDAIQANLRLLIPGGYHLSL